MSEADVVQNFVEFCESDFGSTVMDREAAYIRERLGAAKRVLDIGCGIGSVEERLNRDFVGLDASMPMLEEARTRTDSRCVLGDASALPFRRESFDAAFAVTTVEFLEDYQATIDEADRVLRPEGRFVVMMLNPDSRYFQRHMKKEDSYFHRCKHRPAAIETYVERRFTVESAYFLGIRDRAVFETDNPSLAAIYAVDGHRRD